MITLCNKLTQYYYKKADVDRVTHFPTYPGVIYISTTDSKGDVRTKYMKCYHLLIENTIGDNNINDEKTKNLNDNAEALINVHVNSSKKPTQKTYIGSDDPSNIN